MVTRLPALPRPRGQQRPPRLRRPPAIPTGPRLYGVTREPERLGGPGSPPAGFVGATTSASEWVVYWALAKALGTPADPRQPPFLGGEGWTYQAPYNGGNDVLGGSIIDFVVYAGASRNDPLLPFEDVGIRVQTERFHVFASAGTQAADLDLKVGLSHVLRVADVYEQDFIGDRSGQAAIILVKRAMAGIEAINPITGGTARRVRA